MAQSKKVEIQLSVTGAEECIKKLKDVNVCIDELSKAMRGLNDLSLTVTTTHAEKGEGIERQVNREREGIASHV